MKRKTAYKYYKNRTYLVTFAIYDKNTETIHHVEIRTTAKTAKQAPVQAILILSLNYPSNYVQNASIYKVKWEREMDTRSQSVNKKSKK